MFLKKNYRHIVLGYFLTAALWILLSDALLFWLTSHETAEALSVFKGWGFVIVTGLVLAVLLRDSYQKQETAFNRIRKLNRLFHVLSGANQKLIRAAHEDDLLADICRILVEVGEYPLVWVGLANTHKTLQPAAHAGDESAYQNLIRGRWEESPEAQGPTGTAFYKRTVQLVADIPSGQPEPWRQQALTHGYAAAIALPIQDNQRILGTFTVYSRHAGAFDEEEVRLLEELAADLGYGLAALRLRKELYLSDQILQQTPDAIIVSDMKRRIIRWVGRAEELFGYSAEEIIGQYGIELRAPENLEQEAVAFQKQFQETGQFFGETTCIRKNGDRFPVESTARIVYDASGKPMAIVGIHRDITERKLAEKSLREQKEMLQTIFDRIPVMIRLMDASGKVILVNKYWEETLGWTQEEVLAHPNIFEALYPDPVQRDLLLKHIQGGHSDWKTFQAVARNGQRVAAKWANMVLSDGSNIGIGQLIYPPE